MRHERAMVDMDMDMDMKRDWVGGSCHQAPLQRRGRSA